MSLASSTAKPPVGKAAPSAPPRTSMAAAKAEETVAGPITLKELLIDSGASHGALPRWYDGMTKKEKVDWTIHFGNGGTSKILLRGSIGNIRNVSICPDIKVPVISVSQLASQMNCPVIFTGENAYILKPNSVVEFREHSIMLTVEQKDGLYPIPTKKFIKRIVEHSNVSDDESSVESEGESK